MTNYYNDLERVTKPITGELYHVSWATPGCIWRCVGINMKTGWVKMKTPKSGKEIWAKVESLRRIRKN
jgi:hypothetical protein